MTHPTKAIYKHLMQDSVRVQNTHVASSTASGTDGYVNQLFNEQDLHDTLPRIQTVSFHTTHTHNGIKFTPYPAGHVLGACMYLIEIAGLNILFTGDYSRESNRHLIPAAVPRGVRVDCLITESTFGISTQRPRYEREAQLMNTITRILNRGGRVLLPVFALGGAQELLLILEEYWTRHEDLQRFPIYFASNLARKCMVVYQTYIDAMNDNIRSKFQASGGTGEGGPWDFKFIRSLKSLERFDDVGGCVMLASPGMLQNGVSRTLLERWAPTEKNGVVITGYSVEGTMARTIQNGPDSIPAVMTQRQVQSAVLGKKAGGDQPVMIPRRCTVEEITFAAHVDGTENRDFIDEVNAPVVILVHGEKHAMGRLRSRLLGMGKFKVYSPQNCEELRIPFRQDKVARVVGRLANEIQPPALLPSPPASLDEEMEGTEEGAEEGKKRRQLQLQQEGQMVSGVLVQNDFKLQLMAPDDLKEYAGLTTTTILCRQRITLATASVELIRWALEGTFGAVANISDKEEGVKAETNGIENGFSSKGSDETQQHHTTFEVMGGAVRVICHQPSGEVEIEWEGNVMNDSIADAVIAVLLTVESSPAAVKQSSRMSGQNHDHNHKHDYDAFGDSPVDEKRENGFEKELAVRNPHANVSPEENLNRLFMFLEAQFGEEAITPITTPKLRVDNITNPNGKEDDDSMKDDVVRSKAEAAELARLHELGIPVPGLEIRVGKNIAKVWLEKLDVECPNKTLGERVKAVVERAVATLAPIWQ